MFTLSCSDDDDNSVDDTDPRDKFIGNWSVNETCTRRIYSVTIRKDPNNSTKVLIDNFADPDFGDPAVGYVLNDLITLDPSSKIGDEWTVSGTGELINEKRMEWDYTLIISGSEQTCTANYSR